MDGCRRSICRGDEIVVGPRRASLLTRQFHGGSPLSVNKPCRILADVQRTRDLRRKTPVTRVASVWFVYVVEGFGAAALQRRVRRRLAGEYHRRSAFPDLWP